MKKLFIRFRVYLPVILIVGILLLPSIGFATDLDLDAGSKTLKGLADILGVIISVLTFLALLMINFFGDLLGTAMITGPEAMRAIQPMWMWVRNLTNILFVGVLLFLAFSNLFSSLGVGGEGGNWTIKEKLPKLIIAIVAINFSLLGFKVVIDAINVGTVAILGIADHKLEPDTSGITKILDGTHTWIKTDTERKDLLLKGGGNSLTEQDIEVSGIGGNKDTVSGGNDCGKEWEMMLTKCKGKKCLLTATKGSDVYVCRGFRESINDLFCRNWVKAKGDNYKNQVGGDDKCLFMMTDNSFSSIVTPKSEPGQNLFATFGSVFMHLEKLPALGAEINSLGAVVTNTLFSAILAIAFIVALVAVFIAMIARVILLWVVLVFSPLLVGASILGVDGGAGGDISGKIVTHLIMPLKVAAAFAVGFVMMSAMIEWPAQAGKEATFVFGPALSQLGVDEYAFLWQIATIVLFWMVAFWAVDNTITGGLMKGLRSAAEKVATTTARSLTVDRPIFSVGTGKEDANFSLGSVLQMPDAIEQNARLKKEKMYKNMRKGLGFESYGFAKVIEDAKLDTTKASSLTDVFKQAGSMNEAIKYADKLADKMQTAGYNSNLVSMVRKIKDKDSMNSALTAVSQAADGTAVVLGESDFGKTPNNNKEDKIKNGTTPTVVAASTAGENNKVSYQGTDEKEVNNKDLVTALRTVSAQDAEQIVSALTSEKNKNIVYTSEEKKALQGIKGADGNTMWSRVIKSDKSGLFPAMSGDSSALEVEVINPAGNQITLTINKEGDVKNGDVEVGDFSKFKTVGGSKDITNQIKKLTDQVKQLLPES